MNTPTKTTPVSKASASKASASKASASKASTSKKATSFISGAFSPSPFRLRGDLNETTGTEIVAVNNDGSKDGSPVPHLMNAYCQGISLLDVEDLQIELALIEDMGVIADEEVNDADEMLEQTRKTQTQLYKGVVEQATLSSNRIQEQSAKRESGKLKQSVLLEKKAFLKAVIKSKEAHHETKPPRAYPPRVAAVNQDGSVGVADSSLFQDDQSSISTTTTFHDKHFPDAMKVSRAEFLKFGKEFQCIAEVNFTEMDIWTKWGGAFKTKAFRYEGDVALEKSKDGWFRFRLKGDINVNSKDPMERWWGFIMLPKLSTGGNSSINADVVTKSNRRLITMKFPHHSTNYIGDITMWVPAENGQKLLDFCDGLVNDYFPKCCSSMQVSNVIDDASVGVKSLPPRRTSRLNAGKRKTGNHKHY